MSSAMHSTRPEATPDQEQQDEQSTLGNVRWLLGFARPATRALLGSIISRLISTLGNAAAIALPAWLIGVITLRLIAGEPVEPGLVIAALLAFALISVVKAVTRYTEQLLGHTAAFRLLAELRIWMIDRLIPQAPAVTDGLGVARLQTVAVRDIDRIEVFFAHTIAPAITAVLIPTTAVVTAWLTTGWQVGLALTAVLLVGILIPLFGARAGAKAAREQAELRADISQHVADTVRLRDDIWAAEAEQLRLTQLDGLDDALSGSLTAGGSRAALRHGLNQLRIWGGTALVLAIGLQTQVVAAESLTQLPWVLVAAALVPGTIAVLETVERLAVSLPAGLEACRRIRQLAAGAPAVREPEQPATPNPSAARSAEMANVSFSYPGRAVKVLEDICLQAPAGAFIGVVGATGSGKSTIVRLLQRHVDPISGVVNVAGVAARELGSAQVSRLVAVADQEPFIASGTVADNLRLADPDASDQALQWAAGIAELDVPMQRPLRHRGESLSGGQRQRLALARTLLRARDPQTGEIGSVLVLDEATSHQDALTQSRIVANLRALGATIVMIAHRLDTLREADRIYVLENGRIAEAGDWEELISRPGAFVALLNAD